MKKKPARARRKPSLEIVDALKGIGGRVAKLRGTRSQRQFARDLGVFQQNVNRYEHLGTTPNAVFLLLLHSREHVCINWLLTGRGRPYLPGRAKPGRSR